jgi:lysylphosphatidylglycerol synthetase-like protein (DUF2156 family)
VRRPVLVTLISFLLILTGVFQVLFGVVFVANRNDQDFLQDAGVDSSELTNLGVVLVIIGALSVFLAFSLLRGSRVARAFVALVMLCQIVGGIYTLTALDSGHRASGLAAVLGGVIVLSLLFGTQKARAFFA